MPNSKKSTINIFVGDTLKLYCDGEKLLFKGKITAVSPGTYWAKFHNPDRKKVEQLINKGTEVKTKITFQGRETSFGSKVMSIEEIASTVFEAYLEITCGAVTVERHVNYRVDAKLPIFVKILSNINEYSEDIISAKTLERLDVNKLDKDYIPARTVDLSAGGMKIKFHKNIDKGTPVECRFSIKGKTVAAVATIIAKSQSRSGTFEYGLSFQRIHPNAVKNIIGYVYEKSVD